MAPVDDRIVHVPDQDPLPREEEVVLPVAEGVGRVRGGGTQEHTGRILLIQIEDVVAVQVGLAVLDEVELLASQRHEERRVR